MTTPTHSFSMARMKISSSGCHRQRGVSLVELMVGLTIGLFILMGLTALLVNSSQTRTELDQSMQQLDNGRYATNFLGTELHLAGYYGLPPAFGSAPAALPDPCLTDAASLKSAAQFHVQGYSQPNVSPVACLGAGDFVAGNDVLVIRRASTKVTALAALDSGLNYIQTNGASYAFDLGANPATFSLKYATGGLAEIHQYLTHIYFVAPCSKPVGGGMSCTGPNDDGGNPIPTLKRLELSAGGWQIVPLVEGVERFVAEYGVDSADNDGSADSYVLSPATTSDWRNVVAVRVHLLARNPRRSNDYLDTKSYQLGPILVAARNDSFKRHAYRSTIRLMNISIQRET